jgi:hypothetical protein
VDAARVKGGVGKVVELVGQHAPCHGEGVEQAFIA